MPTKIETSLSPEQLQEFFKRCSQLKGCLLKDVKALAEEFGVEISLMSASRLRDGAFSEYLAELKAKREMAETVATVAKSGLSLSDAAASVLSQKIFDQALSLDANGEGALDESNTLSLALSRLRIGDQRAKLLESQLAEADRKAQEWQEKRDAAKAALSEVKSKGGLSKETLAKIEEAAGLL
jgi:hypothetical protein